MFGGGYSPCQTKFFLDKTYPSPHRMADFLYYATELHVVVLLHKSSRGYLIKPRSKSGLHII